MSLADQASLLLIPSGYKSQKVYSIFPTDGDGDFNFSRSGVATRIAKNGLITTVDSNVPRLEYPLIDGVVNGCPSLLLEPESTNLIAYSQEQSAGSWYSGSAWSVLDNSQISPEGVLNASSLTEDLTNGFHSGYYTGVINNSYTGDFTISCFAKYNGRDISLSPKGATERTFFDLQNGIVSQLGGGGVTAKIENYGNGWFRCSVTCSFSNQTVYFEHLLSNNNSLQYQGNGTSGIYIFGCQAEELSYATSYIPTNGSAVTRQAETCNGAGDAATFNDSEGVLMVETSALADTAASERIAISDGVSSNNRVVIEYDETFGLVKFWVTGGGTTNGEVQISGINKTQNNKISLLYQSNVIKVYINGFNVGNGTGVVTPTGLDTLKFEQAIGGNNFYGKTKQVQYYNSALTDSELEKISSWTSFTDMAQAQQYSII